MLHGSLPIKLEKMKAPHSHQNPWPALRFEDWKETLITVQLWLQIVGKVRMRNMPWINHSWHVTFYVSSKGLTTGSIPFNGGIFQLDFDFENHQLLVTTSWGSHAQIALYPRTVASFYRELFDALKTIGIDAYIHAAPNEMEPAIPFEKDETHKSYDKEKVYEFWQTLIKIHHVFTQFRAGFVGKCSPVHLFWGAFDLAVTRFSGRPAPKHPGGVPNMPLKVMQEAYSHEVSSCGFWPGSETFPHPAFYAYCYPMPPSFGKQPVEPKEAFFSEEMGEFLLLYDIVRQLPNPEEMLMAFLHSTYEAVANTGHWNREALETDFSSFER